MGMLNQPAAAEEALEEKIRALAPWFHNLRIQGIETAPDHFLGDYPRVKFAAFRAAIPENLRGKSVLDIGCNAGFYSLEMKRRGAARVVGIDTDEHYLRQARFAAEMEDADVEFLRMPVWDVAALGEKFDLVIFMGVLYHLRHPLLALDLIHEHVAKDLLLFQSMQRGSREVHRGGARITTSTPRRRSMIRRFPRCTSSSIATRTMRRTGGFRIAPAWRRCCGLQDSASKRTRKTKCMCAAGSQ